MPTSNDILRGTSLHVRRQISDLLDALVAERLVAVSGPSPMMALNQAYFGTQATTPATPALPAVGPSAMMALNQALLYSPTIPTSSDGDFILASQFYGA